MMKRMLAMYCINVRKMLSHAGFHHCIIHIIPKPAMHQFPMCECTDASHLLIMFMQDRTNRQIDTRLMPYAYHYGHIQHKKTSY